MLNTKDAVRELRAVSKKNNITEPDSMQFHSNNY